MYRVYMNYSYLEAEKNKINNNHNKSQSPFNFETSQYSKITNQYTLSPNKNDCNPFQANNYFGNYFQSCQTPSVVWGSEKPINESCPTEYKDHSGQPCHSLWNNSTKRKIIINS